MKIIELRASLKNARTLTSYMGHRRINIDGLDNHRGKTIHTINSICTNV